MKTYLITILILLASCSLYAQNSVTFGDENNQEIKTIFKKEKRDGFYGAFSAGYSSIDNKDAGTFSARGCWIMDHFFSFGLGGTGFVNDLDKFSLGYYNHSDDSSIKLGGGYGGIILEPILLPMKPVHLSFPILVGVGATGAFKNYDYFSTYNVNDFFWVVEPQAELEVNFTRWLRFAVYAGYRYTSELDIENISKDALRGYSAGVTVKMGMF
ncbi:MAG TPA: hypothetical protein PKH79_03745 [Prolixibacteraceae bacterium]|nr:hypothetical protein [Prolixibacteraceae bacterium]HPS13561.1 hypothetical protein [Prolixibacteraceae bacterium]